MEQTVMKVKTYEILAALPNHSEGEVALVEDENQFYIYKKTSETDGEWMKVQAEISEDGGLQLNLYELNKQIISQLPNMDEEGLKDLRQAVAIWKSVKEEKMFMLYGREINYFTLFKKYSDEEVSDFDSFLDAIVECLANIGHIRAYDVVDESAIEFWIANNDNDVTALYLFGYDTGVVTYNE